MLFVVIGTSTCSPNTCYQIEHKKSAKFHVTSGVQKRSLIYNVKNVKISRGVNTFSYDAFVSPHGGLGGPPSFVACESISVVVIELWAVEAFCLAPVIACLFFVFGVLSKLEMQLSLMCNSFSIKLWV
jgi:hypothetical protein